MGEPRRVGKVDGGLHCGAWRSGLQSLALGLHRAAWHRYGNVTCGGGELSTREGQCN